MDDSFVLDSALERFLFRYPKLRSFPDFDHLSKKGDKVTKDEVVKGLVNVFVNPCYTIPMVGCFRGIVEEVVVKTVELLKSQEHILRTNKDEGLGGFGEDGDLSEVFSVVEFYCRAGRGLDLHEHACLAFCRALDLAPFLMGSVESYFEFAPPPFERILKRPIDCDLSFEVGTCELYALRISFGLLLNGYNKFSEFRDFSRFLKLVSHSTSLDLHCSASNILEVYKDIRWCELQIVSFFHKLSVDRISNLGITDEDAFSCLLRWKEFCWDVSLENSGLFCGSFKPVEVNTQSAMNGYRQRSCVLPCSLDTMPVPSSQGCVTEPQIKRQRNERSAGNSLADGTTGANPFVLTSAVKKSYEMMLLAVSQRWPVLLYGPTGSGKSALISKLSEECGNQVLSIHMDDQIDGRTLIGSYVCTEKPGEFIWQPGSLTQAVSMGYWVVFENIDQAPSDVHSIISPLLDGARSFATGHGQEIRVAQSFRLFSTVSTSNRDVSCIAEGGSSLSAVWRRVMVAHSTIEDLQTIVKLCYPSLECLSVKLTETLGNVNSVILQQTSGYQPGNSTCSIYPSRFFSRDLLKWCKRIEGLKLNFYGNNLDCDVKVRIYEEAVAIFAAFSTSVTSRLIIMKEIARIWEVPTDYSETLYPAHKHKLQELITELKVSLSHSQSNFSGKRKYFIDLDRSICLLERLASSVKWNEPVLLVGETGTGKTTLVQDLAGRLDQKLTVLNLSQQSDVADLLGGYKPMDESFVYPILYKEFEHLFKKSFSVQNNNIFLTDLQEALYRKNWEKVRKIFSKAVDHFQKSVRERMEVVKKGGIETVEETKTASLKKRKRMKPRSDEEIKAWENFKFNLENVCGMIFSFVEGAFITAMKNGEWILLDEVNLAPPETLQRIMGVLEGEHGSLCLAERGDISYVERHPNFRVFACMNPATEAGKRDLPLSLRSRFTEYFVDEVLDDKDLERFVQETFGDQKSKIDLVDRKSMVDLVKKIVCFYKTAKKLSEEKLQDGANQKPQYSLRSLYRALKYAEEAEKYFGFEKAIYDGFCMFFLTLLDKPSAVAMEKVILELLLEKKCPKTVSYNSYLSKCYTIGENSDEFKKKYIITGSVKEHLRNLSRAIWTKKQKYPVLLQGPTSSGKTSLVRYLAAVTNHNFVRINNHEHTDLQEYLGSYVVDISGNLVFQEGVLVKAVRNGDWIVLDELNLAPSDVLEALNRLLDDNRELYVPELQESIHAHPSFMLFATQNPPGLYGGRKMLSRAFRNRFVEIHVDEIPDSELSTILERRRPGLSPKMARNMVSVMKKLQEKRQLSNVFAGKHGFITPRDLFRWADRFIELGANREDLMREDEDLVRDGYYLLAERLRDEGEKCVVKDVLQETFRVRLGDLYNQQHVPDLAKCRNVPDSLNVSWTNSMQRLFFLVDRCYRVKEPVLLVGETGAGKTTVCQLLSIILDSELHILNCHQYSETSDFLGGFYPIRDRSRLMSNFKLEIESLTTAEVSKRFHLDHSLSSDIVQAPSVLSYLNKVLRDYKGQSDVTSEDRGTLQEMIVRLSKMHHEWKKPFTWHDGPLVEAMKKGDLFLVDEISLADDSVLERLNSVLEPERTLSLAERGGPELEEIVAHDGFFLLATMNPGGDFGKKELSPALRNRFTEIWVPPVDDIAELRSIALRRFELRSKRLSSVQLTEILDPMLSFWKWFNDLKLGRMLTVRDLLSWVDFINVTELSPQYAFLHGAFLVLLDGLSLGSGMSKHNAEELRKRCLSYLLMQMGPDQQVYPLQDFGWGDLETATADLGSDSMQCDNSFGVSPFFIAKGAESCDAEGFEILAPTTRRNALRVLRAMQLPKPVLLEGSPGVGKTSLVVALGRFSGHKVVRINLSEQTDMMDLLGSYLPVESDDGIKFAWSDGILLQALNEGSWVLLDELNLAPQSVLEGLNAVLDHRAEVFIPELNRKFECPPSFRIFACQNPSHQGGGRKGLPKSFLNRFIKVYVEELVDDDYHFICSSLYPSICTSLLSKLISFNKRMYEETMMHHNFAVDGSPWEFNLRDVIRSCQIIKDTPSMSQHDCFLDVVYVQRMRTESDRRKVLQLYEQIFKMKPYINPYPRVRFDSQFLYVGNAAVKRSCVQSSALPSNALQILPEIRRSLEAAACCVQNQWMCILISPASSGKTSLIRLLAQLTGNVLNELHLSSGTDISELLGCFEQYNAFRNLRSVITQVKFWVNELCCLQLESSNKAFLSSVTDDSLSRWFAVLSNLDEDSVSCFTSTKVEEREKFSSLLTLLIKIMKHLKLLLENNNLSVSCTNNEVYKVMKTIFKLQEGYERRAAKFEWVTGVLIKAVERGEWIVLENANCCNPSVLDRINSLVEPSGSITLNECGVVDGRPVVLQPHSNFRVFLTVNPRYGEVSRAMRNRGVEIFVMPPYWLMDEKLRSRERIELNDVKRFLVLSGIPFAELVTAMAKSHIYARKEGSRFNVCVTYLELSRWVQLFQQLLKSGSQHLWSLQTSWEHIYISSFGDAVGEYVINHGKNTYLSVSSLCKSGSLRSPFLCLPGGSPMSMRPRDLVWHSKESFVMNNCMYLEYLGAKYVSYKLHIARNTASIHLDSTSCGFFGSYLLGMKMITETMNRKAPKFNSVTPRVDANVDKALAKVEKKLLFAANWVFEQATEGDLKLYLLLFSWFSSQIQPFCDFFDSLVKSVTLTVEHKIWKYVSSRYHMLTSHHRAEFKKQLVPMLHFEVVDAPESQDPLKFLHNAIYCIMPLRVSYQQWSSEDIYFCEKNSRFKKVIISLRKLEEQFINKFIDSNLIESPSFDTLLGMYTDLLEDHKLFWDGLKSSEFELSLLSWHMVVLKDARKLKEICPQAVDDLLRESSNLDNTWRFHSEKSLLWIHGGHPVLPRSAEVFRKQILISELCELIWPTCPSEAKSMNSCLNINSMTSSVDVPIDFVCPDIRSLVLEGVSITSCITGNSNSINDDERLVMELGRIYENLGQMIEKQKTKSKEILSSNNFLPRSNSFICCSYSSEALGYTSGHEAWRDTSPLVDCTSFALDVKLLLKLSHVHLGDHKRMPQAIVDVSGQLQYALDFSLHHSSRPPQVFSPHQKILWVLDERNSVDAAHVKLASFVLELWFKWHQSLWSYCPLSVKSFSRTDDYDISVPDVLLQPVVTAIVSQIMQSSNCAIQHNYAGSLKLRAASSHLWHISHPGANLPGFLVSAAHSLFQQIVYAHERSYVAHQFAEIKSLLKKGNSHPNATEESAETFIELLGSLISKSTHDGLKESVNKFIKPLLFNLYLPHCLSQDSYFNHGCVWMRLGLLRFSLLLSCDDVDPAMKYYYKHLQTAEKISLLKLETQVREKCDYLAGHTGHRESDEKRVQTLEKLEAVHKKLERKIIFRSNFGKYKDLKRECKEFLDRVTSDVFFQHVTNDKASMSSQQLLDLGSHWQKNTTGFIKQLLSESEYSDFVLPILVALYEMKLGLSLILASIKQKEVLDRFQMDNTNMILGSVYSFMRFPSVASSKAIYVERSTGAGFPTFNLEIPTVFSAVDMGLLEKLLTFSSNVGSDNQLVSATQLKGALFQNILVRVAHFVTNARVMDRESFKLLEKIFSESASHWMNMKIHMKDKHDRASQQFMFRARAFKIESIIELNLSSLEKSYANESFLEWKNFLAEEGEVSKEQGNSEEEVQYIEDASMKDVVEIHNQLFGTSDLVKPPGHDHIQDADRASSFTASHTLGQEMLKGLGGSFVASLDAKLVPENLFRICLEHEHKFNLSDKSSSRYSFYKDPNTTKMYEMVEALTPLQQRISSLLNEYEDHPQLQKILDIIKMLLDLPLSTPLAKPLTGLQFLVKCLDLLQDGSKFSFADQVTNPINELVISWRKLELESWPALLDEVQDQYEVNAGKLWFPLYSVLRKRTSPDPCVHKLCTNQSVEDFICTSSIGEFKRRIKLLFAFLGQIKAGLCMEVYPSYQEKEFEEVLYNAVGYYVQFLPKIFAHIESGRSVIEKKLKDLLKPYRWELHDSAQDSSIIIEKKRASLMSIDVYKAKRQKLRKIIQEYTVLLEQPVNVFLQQVAAKGTETCSHSGQSSAIDNVNKKIKLLDPAFDWAVIDDEDRCIWYTSWVKEVDAALCKLQCGASIEFGPAEPEGIINQWSSVGDTLRKIIRKTMDCCELWKDANKSQKKARSFADLLSLLKSSGLSRDIFTKDEVNSWWFVEPSSIGQHLLLTQNRLPHVSDSILPNTFQHSSHQDLVTDWRMANAYYFTSVESVLFTQQQVGMQDPYLQQLIKVQQDQHRAANRFSENLRRLKECISTFENCIDFDDGNGSKWSIGQNQLATLRCMWQQKQLFDSLYNMTQEEVLLLKTVENTHLNTCPTVKNEVNELVSSVEKFIPELQKSKEPLDNYLLGPERTIRPSQSFITSKQMEKLAIQNFEVNRQFEAHLIACHAQDAKSSIKDTLLHHFLEIVGKVKLLESEFHPAMEKKTDAINEHDRQDFQESDAAYQQALRSTFDHIVGALQKLGSSCKGQVDVDKSLGHITSWGKIFDIFVENMSLDQLCDMLLRTIFSAEKLVNHHRSGDSTSLLIRVEADIKQLHQLLNIVLDFGHVLLKELLAMRKTVSLTTHILASLLAVSSNAPTISTEDNGDDATHDVSQEQDGTGMGDGVGRADVSDQITDEDQLIGVPEKQPSDENDAPEQAPSKDDKGIEMEQDFDAEKSNFSDDSEEETNPNDDENDEQLETEVGPTGEDGTNVDEKRGNQDEDENLNKADEKYESGSSVVDKDASSKELRAKEDTEAVNGLGELDDDDDEMDEPENEAGNQDDPVQNGDERNLNGQEDMECEEPNPDGKDPDSAIDMDVDDPDVHGIEDEDVIPDDGHESPTDENKVESEGMDDPDATSEMDGADTNVEENTEMDSGMTSDVFEPGLSDSISGDVPNAESSTHPKGDSKTLDTGDVAPESTWMASNEVNNELAPVSGLPSSDASEMDMMTSDSSNTGKNAGELPKDQRPKQETPSVCKSQPNPYRSVGDALKEWEERVRVSVDLEVGDLEPQDAIDNENVEEFGYVNEYEKGTAQALGSATSEQIDKNVSGNKINEEGVSSHEDDSVVKEIEKQIQKIPNRSSDSIVKNNEVVSIDVSPETLPDEGSQLNHDNDDIPESMVVVSIKKSYLSDGVHQHSELSVYDDDMGKAQDLGVLSDEATENATVLWGRYERVTTRLSQELAEQLRLVMEPTLASKLEGDYKTGKRINMKKVIPYIASEYQKDKIWLRRTRPNKRDYQVVIAVDDSRSMSESCCGDVAIEALVTVCRAMSQLELGNLAVASFGKKGNIKLLHDFDQPFNGDAGVKIISGLSFKQENTILDEPVVDLLKFVNTKLDTAVSRSRLPSGRNPLQQLVLIIADGHLHEKERLKRCVRDALAKNRMVAFLLVDNPQNPHNSVMNIFETCYEGGEVKFTKYMESFPFPYYIALRNIEALPRTLADLLRQWFELMQQRRD